MARAKDPLLTQLNGAATITSRSSGGAIEQYFGDRPDVKKAILAAHARGVAKTEIARILTRNAPDGVIIKDGSVRTWLDANQPKTR